jgi:hypothetical protein
MPVPSLFCSSLPPILPTRLRRLELPCLKENDPFGSTGATTPAPEPSKPSNKMVFILAGQSIMARRDGVVANHWDSMVPGDCPLPPLCGIAALPGYMARITAFTGDEIVSWPTPPLSRARFPPSVRASEHVDSSPRPSVVRRHCQGRDNLMACVATTEDEIVSLRARLGTPMDSRSHPSPARCRRS